MKLLTFSDVHIDTWDRFSNLDEKMISSRLKTFIKLAELVKEKSIQEKIDVIAIAGDLANKGTNIPSVVDHIRSFLEILNSINIPVLIINGNHDVATKTDNLVYYHSILKPLVSELKNIILPSKAEIINIKGFDFLLLPWSIDAIVPEEFLNKEADILIGHQIVKGTKNTEGYEFKTGFEKSELRRKYKFSILGHIHKFQYENRVLVPGSPIQNSYVDFYENYIHIIEFNSETKEYININSIDTYKELPNVFHRFLYTTDIEDIKNNKNELIHYKLKNKTLSSKDVDLNSEKVSNQKNNIRSFIEEFIIEDTKNLNLDEEQLEKRDILLKEFLDNLKENNSNIADIKLKKIHIENFLSINKLDFDFSDFSEKIITITGDNGSGKTTLAEAILWSLTGELTKPIKVNNIANTKLEKEKTVTELELNINNKEYKICRTRKQNKPYLELHVLKDGLFYELTTESTTKTQELIYNLLTLSFDEIKLFSYFSSDSALSFNSLNKVERTNIINKMFQVTELDLLKEISKEKLKKNSDELLEVDSSIATLQNLINKEKEKIEYIKAKTSEEVLQNTQNKKQELKNSIEKINNYINEKYQGNTEEKIKILNNDLTTVENRLNIIEKEINTNNYEKNHLETELKSFKEGVCPVCKKEFTNETLKKEKEEKLNLVLEKINSVKPELEKLNKIRENIKNEINFINSMNIKLNNYMKELSVLENSEDLKNLEQLKTFEDYINNYNQDKLIKEENKTKLLKLNVLLKYFVNIFKKDSKLVDKLNELGLNLIQETINDVLKTINSNIECKVNIDYCEVKFHDEFREYNTLSKGQQRIIDILFMVSLNLIFSKLNGLKNGIVGLTVLDEVISFLDPHFTELSLDIIDQLNSENVILITHNKDIINEITNCIKVSLINGFSKYEIINS